MTKGLKDSADSENEIKSELVRQLATILDETDLSEIEYDTGSLRIRVARQIRESSVVMTAATRSAGVATAIPVNEVEGGATDPATHPGAVKAPMVGVAYLSAEPNSPPFVKAGDKVTEGQTLLLIEAMKTFNPVHAPRSGTIASILVSDGQPIEFDQSLVIIE
jgi:acetyl-CoA carboxylase biotin carboxyl carrier protein